MDLTNINRNSIILFSKLLGMIIFKVLVSSSIFTKNIIAESNILFCRVLLIMEEDYFEQEYEDELDAFRQIEMEGYFQFSFNSHGLCNFFKQKSFPFLNKCFPT